MSVARVSRSWRSSGAWLRAIAADLAAATAVPGLVALGWLFMTTMTRSFTCPPRACATVMAEAGTADPATADPATADTVMAEAGRTTAPASVAGSFLITWRGHDPLPATLLPTRPRTFKSACPDNFNVAQQRPIGNYRKCGLVIPRS